MYARRLLSASLVCAVLVTAILPGIAAAEPPNFAPAATKSSASLVSVEIADFTGDEKLDVAASTSDFKVLVFPGSTGDNVGTPVSYDTRGTSGSDMHLASGDFNDDGMADLAISHVLGIDVFRQTPEGTFSSNPVNLLGAKGVEVGDVDDDGNEDLVAGTTAGPVVLVGNGDGTFDLSLPKGTGDQSDLEVGDFVGDDGLDIAGSSGSNVTVYRQLANGAFQQESVTLPAPVSSLAIGDFAGDAGNDLAAATAGATPSVRVFSQTDDNLGSPATVASASSPQGLTAGDVNADNAADLVAAHGGLGKVGVYVRGETAPGGETLYGVPNTPSYGPGAVGVGNVVGDVKADIVVGGSGGLSVLRGIAPVTPSPSPTPTETPDPEELTQSIPYSVWTQPSGSPLDGMGSWLAVAQDSAAGEGQLEPQYAHSEIFWSETRETLGLVSLVVNGDDKVATFAVINGTGAPEVVGIPYEWVEGGFYLPLVHRLGDGTWGAWIFDWANRDQGDEAWTFIGQLDAPAQNRISSISATLSFWYGEVASDCSEYPAAAVLRYPTLGLAGGQGSIATLAGHDAAEGDCDSQVSTPEELDVWDLYQLGAEEADTE